MQVDHYKRLGFFVAVTLAGTASAFAQTKPCPPPTLSVSGGTTASTNCSSGTLIADKYPGDVGIANDADVLWAENFEEGSVSGVTSRYSDSNNPAGMSLTTDVPAKSGGKASIKLTSGGTGAGATDFFKNFGTGVDEMYVRYYAKYQGGGQWHHTSVWAGGYNPPMNWANPQAGLKPNGDERFSIAFEPVTTGNNVQLDFYNYWMGMHSWMDTPSGTTAYYGNSFLQDSNVKALDSTWVCVELHLKLNPDGSSATGGELGVWLNDASLQQFTSSAPKGYWMKDKFCPENTTNSTCTSYRSASTPLVPLDLRYRSTTALKLNYIWVQNYITDAPAASVWFDDLVVAKRRIGCLR
jgi:hypothetical protein